MRLRTSDPFKVSSAVVVVVVVTGSTTTSSTQGGDVRGLWWVEFGVSTPDQCLVIGSAVACGFPGPVCRCCYRCFSFFVAVVDGDDF